MKPVSSQPPLPMTPNQNDVTSISSWTGDITRQLYTYLREIVYRLNKAVTHDVLVSTDKDEGASLVGVEDSADHFTGTNVEEVLAEIGTSLAGGGNVTGPSSSIADRLASFDGTSGKIIKDSGYTAASFLGATAQAVDSAKLGGQASSWYQQNVSDIGQIEINANGTGDRYTYIDFHSQAATVDYDARIIRNAGVNGALELLNTGTGPFLYNDYAIWHAGNFDAAHAALTNVQNTFSVGQQVFKGAVGAASISTYAGYAELQAQGTTGAAIMSFHRPGLFAAYFGIDTDNKWKVGGWSMGANAYEIWHRGNSAAASAWVTFVGSTGAIRDGYNVSSVTRNAAGDYTVHFATAMANANYGFSINAQRAVGAGSISAMTSVSNAAGAIGTTALRVITGDSSGNPVDAAVASVVVFGGK